MMDSIKVIETRSHGDMVSSKVNRIQVVFTFSSIIATEILLLILNGITPITLLSLVPTAMSVFITSLLLCIAYNSIYVKFNYDKILEKGQNLLIDYDDLVSLNDILILPDDKLIRRYSLIDAVASSSTDIQFDNTVKFVDTISVREKHLPKYEPIVNACPQNARTLDDLKQSIVSIVQAKLTLEEQNKMDEQQAKYERYTKANQTFDPNTKEVQSLRALQSQIGQSIDDIHSNTKDNLK